MKKTWLYIPNPSLLRIRSLRFVVSQDDAGSGLDPFLFCSPSGHQGGAPCDFQSGEQFIRISLWYGGLMGFYGGLMGFNMM
jgi:hypothetical protein